MFLISCCWNNSDTPNGSCKFSVGKKKTHIIKLKDSLEMVNSRSLKCFKRGRGKDWIN